MKIRTDHSTIVELCRIAETYTEVEAKLGLTSPNTTLRKYVRYHGIAMPRFLGQRAANMISQINGRRRKLSVNDLRIGVLLGNREIKVLLFRAGLKVQACEKCGWRERRPSDGKMPLHLHHKNGDTSDCRLENLEILCPNCHSLTENYCGCKGHRNPGRATIHEERQALLAMPTVICEVCGRLGYGERFCSTECARFSRRVVERPSRDKLAEDLRTMTWLAIGRKYNVSDNAVRKWARACGLLGIVVD